MRVWLLMANSGKETVFCHGQGIWTQEMTSAYKFMDEQGAIEAWYKIEKGRGAARVFTKPRVEVYEWAMKYTKERIDLQ